MRVLLRTILTLALLLPFSAVSYAGNEKDATIKEMMEVIHDHFGVNFIYDSSLELDIKAPQQINPSKQSLVVCLAVLFADTGIDWEIQKKYVVLTNRDKKRKAKDYTIFFEEQRDTINESVIIGLTTKEMNTTQTGLQKLDGKVFKRSFAVLSSPDVIKTLQQLPGVTSGTELLSGMYVRGGDGADNLYLLDGIPLYQVSHLGGLFSSFNTDVVESVDFYKSGFPARYGGRMSSVVDVRTREGDYNDYHGLFSIGLLDGRFQFEGPIIKDKTSFNIGLRRSWIDVLAEPVCLIISRLEESKFRIKYVFWDLNANLTHKFSEDNKLSFMIYGGRDAAKMKAGRRMTVDYNNYITDYMDSYGLEWGNFVSSLNWDYKFADNHETSVKAYYSLYDSMFGIDEDYFHQSNGDIEELYSRSGDRSSTSDLGLKADFSYRPADHHHIRYGATLQYHFYTPESFSIKKNWYNNTVERDLKKYQSYPRQSFESGLYVEDEMILNDRLTANLGLRYTTIITEGKIYHSLEPRAAIRIKTGDYTTLKLSYSEMSQNNHLISSNYLQLPTSFWMPSTPKIAPSHSRQVSGGVYLNLPHNIKWSSEAYYKTMDNLLEFSGKWGLYPPITRWEEAMTAGKGRSWGLENELTWSNEKTSLEAYYTLSWSQRFFPDFYPTWYKDRNDNRHKITLVASRRFGKRFEMFASWNYHSGGWMTAKSQAIWNGEIGDNPEMFYTYPNNLQIPDYHRLDIGFNFHKTTKRGNESIWNLSLYNVYCRLNPLFSEVKKYYDFTEDNMIGLYYVGASYGVIPIIPSFSYTLKF